MRSLCALCLLAAAASAQTPTFAVASIKAASPDARGYSLHPLPGRLVAENVTLKQLIAEAWHVYDFQISGGPKWIDSDRFDVEAKTGAPATPHRDLRLMLQALLVERFALRVRHEDKEVSVYELVPAKGGPRLQPTKDPNGDAMFRVYQRRQVESHNAPLDHLTEVLTWLMGKPVLDRTSLEGAFDYKLEWNPDEQQLRSNEAPVDSDGRLPSLDSALQQQLGLKLIARKEMMDTIVAENAVRPAAN
jgi:uncharacterized protein (TIGR03435 family)